VVAGQDRPAGFRNEFGADDVTRKEQPEERADEHVLAQGIQHDELLLVLLDTEVVPVRLTVRRRLPRTANRATMNTPGFVVFDPARVADKECR
jgi:hypothetical protein